MKISRLFLRNYRVYEQALELEIPSGLVGIYGRNGAGKSALVESVLWTLWGKSRTAKDEIRTAGVRGECITEVEFEHEGHLYLIRRTISPANAVKAEAFADRQQVANGVRDTQRYVHSVLGMDDSAFRASVFAEQKQLATFSSQQPEQRRKLVLQLLGITPLDTARNDARADAKTAHDDVERLRALLPDLDELRDRAEQLAAAAERADQDAKQEAEVADRRRAEAIALDEKVAELEQVEREHDSLVADGKAVRAEHDAAVESLRKLTKELEELDGAAKQLDSLRPLVDGLDDAEQRLALVSEASHAAAALAAVPERDAPPEPDEDGADSLRQEAEEARAAVAAVDGELVGAKSELERAKQAATLTSQLSGEAECPTCGQELGDSFERVQQHRAAEVAEIEKRIAALVARRDELHALATRTTAAASEAAAAVKAARKAWSEYERDRDRRSALESRLAAAIDALGAPPEEGEADRLRANVDERRRARDAAGRIEGRLLRRPAVEKEITEQEGRRAEAASLRQTLLDKVQALGFDRALLEDVRAKRNEARAAAERAQGAAHQASLQATRADTEAKAAAEKVRDVEAQHAALAERAEEARHLGRLAELLGSFRRNVIAAVGPRLSAQAAELFAELTDRDYDMLEVDPEDYGLRIRDQGRSYGMERFSGSETDLANLALRVAISEQVRFQSGGAVGLLVLDEVFGPLDDDRKERMLLALERLRGRFRQVLVVTHANEIKEQLPSAIEVVKLPGRRATARIIGVDA